MFRKSHLLALALFAVTALVVAPQAFAHCGACGAESAEKADAKKSDCSSKCTKSAEAKKGDCCGKCTDSASAKKADCSSACTKSASACTKTASACTKSASACTKSASASKSECSSACIKGASASKAECSTACVKTASACTKSASACTKSASACTQSASACTKSASACTQSASACTKDAVKSASACTYTAEQCADKVRAYYEDHGWLGVELDIEANESGPVVTSVYKNSPADKAGVRAGDVLTSLNGISAAPEYSEQLHAFMESSFDVGKRVRFTVKRDREILPMSAVLSKIPNDAMDAMIEHHLDTAHVDETELKEKAENVQ